jgi:hypothetical protein
MGVISMSKLQQEIIIDTLNAEMDRYWTRFNIFTAVQIGALLGVLNSLQLLILNPLLFRFIFIFLVAFSLTGVVSVLRGHDLQRGLVLTLSLIEKDLVKEHRLLFMLKRNWRFPTFLSNYSCSFFAILCCCAWILAWAWLEFNHYASIIVPLKQ